MTKHYISRILNDRHKSNVQDLLESVKATLLRDELSQELSCGTIKVSHVAVVNTKDNTLSGRLLAVFEQNAIKYLYVHYISSDEHLVKNRPEAILRLVNDNGTMRVYSDTIFEDTLTYIDNNDCIEFAKKHDAEIRKSDTGHTSELEDFMKLVYKAKRYSSKSTLMSL